jgi:hypothetical protein
MGGLLSRLSGREVLQTNLSRLLSPLFAQTEMRASASIANTAPPVNQASLRARASSFLVTMRRSGSRKGSSGGCASDAGLLRYILRNLHKGWLEKGRYCFSLSTFFS